jgi:hypothetical protein
VGRFTLAAAVTALVFAGATSATAGPRAKSPPRPLALGVAATFAQGSDALRVKPFQIVDPVRGLSRRPHAGMRLVAVKTVIRNIGRRAVYAGSGPCTQLRSAVLVDARRGGRHRAQRGLAPDLASFFVARSSPYVETGVLAVGQAVTGYFTFELPVTAKPALFTLSPCRARAARTWRLR